MKNNSFNLTYVEAFLLLTQSMSAYALHQQHTVFMNQNNIITNLSNDLKKLNSELIEIKSINTQNTMQISTKMSDAVSISNIPSFIDPKIILGLIGAGVVYFYVIPALSAKLVLPSLKSLLIPIKSGVVSLIPFIKEEKVIEFIKDSCVYRVKLIGDQVSGLDARQADSASFEPVSDLINQSNNLVNSAVQTTESTTSLPLSTVSNIVPTSDVSTAPDIVAAVDITELTLSMLSTL